MFRSYLQNKNQAKITGPKRLYNWDRVNFQTIDFYYCGKNKYKTHSENLERRYSKPKTLKKQATIPLFCSKK